MSLPLPPSLWAATAPPAPACPALDADAACEVAVVGAGFTGLSAALHLAESGVEVRVLEAGEPGWGASGRNGGQVNPGFRVLPPEVSARYGEARAARMNALGSVAPALVFDLIERHGIDCHPVRAGLLQGCLGRAGTRYARDWVEQWRALGAPVRFLDHEEMSALAGTRAYPCGMLDERGGNLQPLAYARGLARAALGAGALIHGDTAVRSLHREANAWRLRSDAGAVSAGAVILATNGYTDALWPGLAREVVPVKSVIAATAPLSDNVRRSILPGGQHLSELRHMTTYYRLDPQGRFVLGGRGDTFGPADAAGDAHLRAAALRLFPQLDGCEWSQRWSGFVAITPERMPRLVHLGHNAWAGLGFNGRGVAMATAMGRELATAVRGGDTVLPRSSPSPIAGHRFRRLGVAARVAWGRVMDVLETRGRP